LASKELNLRVEELLKKMTLEEKIGQLVQFSVGNPTGPNASSLKYDEMAAKGQVGSFLNVVGAEATNHFQHIAVEKSRLHIPILFGQDVIHGHRTTFPVPLAVAASWDPAAAELVARTGATEARADGLAWVFSPMVDIARDPRWGRIIESAGEDPYLGSAMARAWVKGYQQDDLSKPDSVAACVKHFAAYGAAIAGRDYNAVDMSEITLRQVYLVPYRAAVEAGAATLMSSFNSINGVPATANPFILTQVLRKEWGFEGFVVSDWGAVGELINHSIGDGPTVARKALEAGLDRCARAKFRSRWWMRRRGGFCASSLPWGCSITPTLRSRRHTTPHRSAAPRHARWPTKRWCCSRTIPSRALETCCRSPPRQRKWRSSVRWLTTSASCWARGR
jgi:beta-glucosidase